MKRHREREREEREREGAPYQGIIYAVLCLSNGNKHRLTDGLVDLSSQNKLCP